VSANLDRTVTGPASAPIQVKRTGCAKSAMRRGAQQRQILMVRRDSAVSDQKAQAEADASANQRKGGQVWMTAPALRDSVLTTVSVTTTCGSLLSNQAQMRDSKWLL
jgi:hypothetical protein